MGQKTNANILRLGVTQNWKTEFFEKNKKELPLYIFKDLEIKDYLERFFETNGAFVHSYRQHYNNGTLNLYISYFIYKRSNFSFFMESSPKILKIVSGKKVRMVSSNNNSNYCSKYIENIRVRNLKKFYLIKNYLQSNRRLAINTFKVVNQKSLKNMLKVISNFMLNKFSIEILFSCVNKDFNYFCSLKDKKVKILRKFQSAPFFKVGVELLFHVVFNRNSAAMLGKFLALNLRNNNTRFNFFLRFLKKTLLILMNSKLSLIKGVKIIFNGRLKKGPRARQKILIVGDVPVQTLKQKLDYYQISTHNAKGSYGIKVWVIEKQTIV